MVGNNQPAGDKYDDASLICGVICNVLSPRDEFRGACRWVSLSTLRSVLSLRVFGSTHTLQDAHTLRESEGAFQL